jgi:hypothetical protein
MRSSAQRFDNIDDAAALQHFPNGKNVTSGAACADKVKCMRV